MSDLRLLIMSLWGLALVSITQGLISSSSALAGSLTAQTSNGLQCQRITVTACQGLGYNMTALPNLAGHTNQLEAELRVGILEF